MIFESLLPKKKKGCYVLRVEISMDAMYIFGSYRVVMVVL